jgi:hypothetical protein
MNMLNTFDVGDFVRLWCIGTRSWDTEVVKIIRKGVFIDIKYKSGYIRKFVDDTLAQKVTF